MSKERIYFYASLPRIGQPPFGGGEIGNMRTLNMLCKAGYDVVTIRQRKAEATWGKIHRIISYPFRLMRGWNETFIKLLFASRNCLVHLSGFAGKTIINEYVLMHIIRGLGFHTIYEIRGGGIVGFWENGDSRYRRMFTYLVRNSCCVFSQGKENIPLLQSITKSDIYHYPNCVERGFAPENYTIKSKDYINLLFYGRLEEDKHIDLVIETASIVQKEIPNVTLTIVGDGNTDYVLSVKNKMTTELAKGSFYYEPARSHDNLKELLVNSHFYIFPSTQPREGQSNSVTECMSYGIIPIASPQGYNRSTIGNDILIVDKLEASEYAKRIIDIIRNGKYDVLSKQMYNRYLENYTEEVIKTNTLAKYQTIIESIYCQKK